MKKQAGLNMLLLLKSFQFLKSQGAIFWVKDLEIAFQAE